MTFKTLFASVSTAALLASPLAAQTSTLESDQPDGVPAEELVQQSDEDTVINPDADANANAELAAGNERVGIAPEADTAQAAGDSPYTIGTVDSLQAVLSDDTKIDSPFVGAEVTTSDGTPVGSITNVYTDGSVDTAYVELDESLGLDTEAFLIQMASGNMMGGDVTLAQNEVEFLNEMAEIVGIQPGAEAKKF